MPITIMPTIVYVMNLKCSTCIVYDKMQLLHRKTKIIQVRPSTIPANSNESPSFKALSH